MKAVAIILALILCLFAYVSCIVANNTDNKIERMNREKEKKK